MTTAAENERLGVLEVKVSRVENDVAEIKGDVKTLLTNQTNIAIALAAQQAVEQASGKARSSNGVWARFFLERAIAILALAAAVVAILTR